MFLNRKSSKTQQQDNSLPPFAVDKKTLETFSSKQLVQQIEKYEVYAHKLISDLKTRV